MNKLVIVFSTVVFVSLAACTSHEEKEISPQEKRAKDSVSKIEQKIVVDSLKKANPLLILPPDSLYTGDYTDKYPNGIVKFKGLFRFGQRHGMWMSFYPNGLAWSEMHYDKGLRHGPNNTYYENGSMRFSGFYKNDVKDSIWCYYDSIGNMAEKILFKEDRMVRKLPLK